MGGITRVGTRMGKCTLNQALWNHKYLNTQPLEISNFVLASRVQGLFKMGPLNVSTSAHILRNILHNFPISLVSSSTPATMNKFIICSRHCRALLPRKAENWSVTDTYLKLGMVPNFMGAEENGRSRPGSRQERGDSLGTGMKVPLDGPGMHTWPH